MWVNKEDDEDDLELDRQLDQVLPWNESGLPKLQALDSLGGRICTTRGSLSLPTGCMHVHALCIHQIRGG